MNIFKRYLLVCQLLSFLFIFSLFLGCGGGGGTGTSETSSGTTGGAGGQGNSNQVVEVLRTNSGAANLTLHNNYLYWSDDSVTPVKRIALDAGGVEEIIHKIGTVPHTVYKLGFLYWLELIKIEGRWVLRIHKRAVDGSSEAIIYSDHTSVVVRTTGLYVDDAYVYWLDYDTDGFGHYHTIERISISGGARETVVTSENEIMHFTGDDSRIYWKENISPPGNFTIKSVPKISGATTTLWTSVDKYYRSFCIAVDAGELFFFNNTDNFNYDLYKMPVSGGSTTLLASIRYPGNLVTPVGVSDIHVEDGTVYWTDRFSVRSIDASGGEVEIISDLLAAHNDDAYFAAGLASDTEAIYWFEENASETGSYNYHSLKKMSEATRTVEVILDTLTYPEGLTTGDGRVFFSEGEYLGRTSGGYTKVSSVPADGGAVHLIATGVHNRFLQYIINDGFIYFIDGDHIKKSTVLGENLSFVAQLPTGAKSNEIVTDGMDLFWLDQYSTICKVSKDGGEVNQMIACPVETGTLRCDNGFLYVFSGSELWRVPVGGGSFSLVLTVDIGGGQCDASEFDDTHLYCASNELDQIYKIAMNGSETIFLSNTTDYGSTDLALDENYVYWANYVDAQKIPKTGGNSRNILDVYFGPVRAFSMLVDDSSVYWVDGDGDIIRVTPK